MVLVQKNKNDTEINEYQEILVNFEDDKFFYNQKKKKCK